MKVVSVHNIEIEKFLEQFNEEYKFLYKHNDNVCGYRDATKTYDELIKKKWFRAFVSEFVDYRGDFISSDREVAAFMFALETFSS